MATDHNFKIKNGLHVEGANTKIVDAGSGNAKLETGGTLSIRPEGTTSNKHFFELNDYTAAGNVGAATMSTTGDIDFGGRTQLRKDLRIRGSGTTANLGVVRFFTNSSSKLSIDPGGTGTNVLTLDSSGNLTVPGNLTVNGTSTTLNVATLDVEDKNITLNKGSGDTSSTADGAGITIQDAVNSSTDATLLWNAGNDNFVLSHDLVIPDKIIHAGDADTYIQFDNNTHRFFAAGEEMLKFNSSLVTINEAAGNNDFRVKGNTEDNLFYVDGSADSVGIGTNTPVGTLEVYDAEPRIHLNRSNAFSWNIWVGNGTTFTNSYLNIAEGSNSKLAIAHTTGNVGIGDSSPDFKLAVRTPAIPSGSTYAWPLDLSRPNTDSRGLTFGVAASGTTNAIAGHNADVGIGHTFGTDSNGLPQYYETMRFKHVDQSNFGLIGVGTTVPEAQMELYNIVDGDAQNLLIMNQKTYGVGSGTNERASINLGIAEASQTSLNRLFGTIHVRTPSESDSSNGILSFGVRGTGAIRDDVLVLRGYSSTDQRVGIGTNNPGFKLDVSSGAIDFPARFVSSDAKVGIVLTDSGNSVYIQHTNGKTNIGTNSSTNTANLTITSGGSVGVQNTDPYGRLQVRDTIFDGTHGVHANDRVNIASHGALQAIQYASTYNSPDFPDYGMVFVHGNSTSNYNVWSISPDGPAKGDGLHFIYGSNTSNVHTITPKVSFDGGGNVGVGTSSPFSKLSINSNGAPTTSGNVATTGLTVHNGTGGTAIQMGTNDSAYSYIQSTYVNAANNKRELRFILGDTTALTLDTSTNATFAGAITVGDDITLANNKDIHFLNSSGSNDGTMITRASGNALRIKYTGNSAIFDALADNSLSIRNSNNTVIFEVDPNSTEANSTTSVMNGVFRMGGTIVLDASRNLTNVTANANIITAGTIADARLPNDISSNVTGYAANLLREDNRTISPSELTAGRLKFGFTSFANNNSSPYADFLHLRSYTDSSGGSDNLVMFKKSGIAARLWQQSWGSSTAYSSYRDFVMTDTTSANVTLGGTLTTASTIKVDPASGDAIVQMEGAAGAQILRIDQNSIRTSTNSDLSIFTNSNSRQLFLKQSNGYVGINMGSSNPEFPLHVLADSDIVFARASNTDQRLYFRGGAGSGEGRVASQYSLELKSGLGGSNAYDLTLSTNAGTALKVDAGDSNSIQFNGAYKFPTSDGSSGQVLKTNGSGVLTFQNDSSGAAAFTGGDISSAINFTPDTGTVLSFDGQAILQRMTANGAITIGHDDAVIIAAGDTSGVMNSNISNGTETVFLGSEGGFIAHAFPNNNTSWSNRKTLEWNGIDGLKLHNLGIKLGTTEIIDSSRNFKNMASADSLIYKVDGKQFVYTPNNNTVRGPYNPVLESIRQSGTPLTADEDFNDGSNGVGVYNNAGGGVVTHTRVTASSSEGFTAPNSSGKVIKIVHNGGTSSPGFGGFVQAYTSSNNRIIVQIFVAKLPVGRSLQTAQNAQGTNATNYFLTSTAGTGKFETYVRVANNGDSGTFSSGGHVYVSGGSGGFTWYLASCQAYIVTSRQTIGARQVSAGLQSNSPAFMRHGDTDTGVCFPGTNQVGLSAGNSRKFYVSSSQAYFQNLADGVEIDVSGGTDNYYLQLKESGTTRFSIYENNNNVFLNGGGGSTIFRPRQHGGSGNFQVTQGNFQVNDSGVVTANGSGLTNLNASNLATGTIPTARLFVPVSGDWFRGGPPIVATDGVMEIGRFLDFHHTDTTTADFDVRLDANTANSLNVTGVSTTDGLRVEGNKVFHAGNDGAGSGLNADLLDGQEGSYYRNASNINAGTVPVARINSSSSTFLLGGIKIAATDNSQNYIAFSGTTGDQPGNFNHSYIGERIYSGSEKSELVLAKYNDVEGASGSDRIRMLGNNIVFDTYSSVITPSADASLSTAVGTGSPSTRMTINQNGLVTINSVNNAYAFKVFGGDTDSFFGVSDDANNSANIIVTRSDGATSFEHKGHNGATTIDGAITSTGALTVTSGNTSTFAGTDYLNINANVGNVNTNGSHGLHIGWNKSSGGREVNMIFDGGTTQADTEMIFTSTDGTTYTDIFQINGGGNVDVKSGGLRIGTTTVIDSNARVYTTSVQSSGKIAFLNGSNGSSGSGAQGIRVNTLYAGTTYASDGAASGMVDTLNGYRVRGTQRIDSSGNFFASDSINIGDDATIDDMNVANTIRVKGQQASNQGFIVFGDNNSAKLGCNNSSTLTYGSNFSVSGDITTSGNLTLAEYIYHSGDTNTYLRFTGDAITLRAGGTDMINIIEGSDDYVEIAGRLQTRDGVDLRLFHSSSTSGAAIHMPRAGYISLYGDTSVHHCIRSANQGNAEADDIMISSYGAVYIDLDSNNNNTSGADFVIGRHNATNSNRFSVSGEDGDTIAAGDVTAFGSPSDIRLKENIELIADPIEKVLKLRGVTFNYKDTGKKSTGLIAQDLEEVLPEVVYETHNINDENDKFKAVRYGNTVGLLVEAIKEQQTIINRLEERIKKLEGEDNGD